MGWGGGNENSTRYAGRAQLTLQEAYLPTLPITAKCITLNLLRSSSNYIILSWSD